MTPVKRISASTIGNLRTCERIFYFNQIVGFGDKPPSLESIREKVAPLAPAVDPVTVWLRILALYKVRDGRGLTRLDWLAVRVMPATLRGQLVHARLEHYYQGEALDPVRNPIDAIAFEALPYLPKRGEPGVTTEREFVLEVDGVRWQGRKDLEWPGNLADHKTTKDKQYSKIVCGYPDGKYCDDPKCLTCNDLQCALYALESMVGAGTMKLAITWNYLITSWGKAGNPKTRCVSRAGVITRERALETVRKANVDAKRATALAMHPSYLTVPPNPEGCRAYGGCDFRKICNLSPEQELEAIMQSAPVFPNAAAPVLPVFPSFPTQVVAITWGPHSDPVQASLGVEVSSDRKWMRDPNGNYCNVATGAVTLGPPPELASSPAAAPAPAPAANPMAQFMAPSTGNPAPPVVNNTTIVQAAPEGEKRKPGRPKGSGKKGATPPTTPQPDLNQLTAATNAAYLAANPEAAARIAGEPGGAEALQRLQAAAMGQPQPTAYTGGQAQPVINAAPGSTVNVTAGQPGTVSGSAALDALKAARDVKETLFMVAAHMRAMADVLEGKKVAQ